MERTLERPMVGIMAAKPFLWNGTQMIETNASREMLGLLYEVPGSMPEDQDELSCESCSEKKAEIFQVTGDYCLHCWQEETHPDV
jgi:hypothetical protein